MLIILSLSMHDIPTFWIFNACIFKSVITLATDNYNRNCSSSYVYYWFMRNNKASIGDMHSLLCLWLYGLQHIRHRRNLHITCIIHFSSLNDITFVVLVTSSGLNAKSFPMIYESPKTFRYSDRCRDRHLLTCGLYCSMYVQDMSVATNALKLQLFSGNFIQCKASSDMNFLHWTLFKALDYV
jgi:hypothetical protein